VKLVVLTIVLAACMDCLGRTPYASLSATILMCLGVGLFCGTGFHAINITLNGIFDNLFKLHVPWSVSLVQCFSSISWEMSHDNMKAV